MHFFSSVSDEDKNVFTTLHQIAQTVAKSSLAKMSDDETRTVTDGQFYTTKEFVNYMTSATTEVGSEIASSAFIFKRGSFGDYRCCFCR
jgi:hypothetical protein